MRRIAAVAVAITTSACTLITALECPYDCVDASTSDAAQDAGCSGPYATGVDGGTQCLDAIDIGNDLAVAVVTFESTIFIVGSSGTIYACSDATCSDASATSSSDAAVAPYFGVAAAGDAGVFWADTTTQGAIHAGTGGKPESVVAAPAHASALAVAGSSVYWAQDQNGGKGTRTCTLGSNCDAGAPVGILVSDAGVPKALAVTAENQPQLAWCDGTQVVLNGNQISTTASDVLATGANALFWNDGTLVGGCTTPCTQALKFKYDNSIGSTQDIVASKAFAWIDKALTIGICPFPLTTTQQVRQCNGPKKFDLSVDVKLPTGIPNGLAYNDSVIVFIEGTQSTAHARRLVP
jgi:hypothetical protein